MKNAKVDSQVLDSRNNLSTLPLSLPLCTAFALRQLSVASCKLLASPTDARRNQMTKCELINRKDCCVYRKSSYQCHTKTAEHVSPPVLSNQSSGDIDNSEICSRSVPRSRLNARFYYVKWICVEDVEKA
jgi:hypothetical protein